MILTKKGAYMNKFLIKKQTFNNAKENQQKEFYDFQTDDLVYKKVFKLLNITQGLTLLFSMATIVYQLARQLNFIDNLINEWIMMLFMFVCLLSMFGNFKANEYLYALRKQYIDFIKKDTD